MAKKTLAAFLLLAIAAWAELAIAPMIAMRAGHMHPGHEMAVDMPGNQAAHHHAEHAQAMTMSHCCPGLYRVTPEALLELASGAPACDEHHRCCFRQGPQNMPTPAREAERMAPDSAPIQFADVSPALENRHNEPSEKNLALPTLPDVLGMTLRV